MLEPFMIKAILTGITIATIAGFLGCVVVWRKMACFSDSISHGVLPGIALGFLFNISLGLSAFFSAIFISILLQSSRIKNIVSLDTFLIIIAQIMFASGLVIIYLNPSINTNIMGLLLGDILTISWFNLILLSFTAIIIIGILGVNWKKIIILCINEEIALSEGINVKALNFLIVILIAIFTALTLQTIGILLATSILLIPTTCARIFSKSPLSMPYIAIIIGILTISSGIIVSYFIDVPSSPAIVLSMAFVLIVSFFFKNKIS